MGTFTERLPCKLTQDEINQKGMGIVDCMRTKVQLEMEKASLVDGIKSRLKDNDRRCVELAQHYESGIEWRDIECEDEKDFEHACVRTFRRDTNELMRTRIMKAEERQAALDFVNGDGGEQLEAMRAGPGDPKPAPDPDDDDEDDDDEAPIDDEPGATAH